MRTAPTPSTWWGLYDHRLRLITLKPGLLEAQYVSTYAHELGHAFYGHHGHHPRNERKADKWAARHLLDFEVLMEHARVTLDAGEIAANIGVMPWVIESFVNTLGARQVLTMMNHVATVHA